MGDTMADHARESREAMARHTAGTARRAATLKLRNRYTAACVALAEDIGLDRHRECPSCGFLNGTAHGAPCTCVKWAAAKAALAAQKGGKS